MPSSDTNIREIKPTDGRRKPRPGPETQRQSIVDAAVELFLEEGSQAVSIMQICDRADVSRSTFYRSFEDKDALLHHLYHVSVIEPVEQYILESLDQFGATEDSMRQTLDATFEAIFANSDYAELVFRESDDPNSPAFALVNRTFDGIVELLQNRLPGFIAKKGYEREVDGVFLKSLLRANQWIAHNAIAQGLTPETRRVAKDAAFRLIQSSLELHLS